MLAEGVDIASKQWNGPGSLCLVLVDLPYRILQVLTVKDVSVDASQNVKFAESFPHPGVCRQVVEKGIVYIIVTKAFSPMSFLELLRFRMVESECFGVAN
jgi:hypothetical protein